MTLQDSKPVALDPHRVASFLNVPLWATHAVINGGTVPEAPTLEHGERRAWALEMLNGLGHLQEVVPTSEKRDVSLPSIVDLFAGCGGLSLAFGVAGFEVLAGFDNWGHAVNTYSSNLDHSAYLLDLSDVKTTVERLSEFQIEGEEFPAIIGGPPCQDFSSAGTRMEGERADLTEKFADVVAHFKPPFFVMENVPLARNSGAYNRAIGVLEEAGYSVHKDVFNAADFGAPQNRRRLIAFGALDHGLMVRVKKEMTGFSRLPHITVEEWFGESLGIPAYYRHPRSYQRRGIFSVKEVSPTIRGVNRAISPNYKKHPGDVAEPNETRHLSTNERAEIQTFPGGYEFTGPRTAQEQMIGNAVPVRLGKFVGDCIRRAYQAVTEDQLR